MCNQAAYFEVFDLADTNLSGGSSESGRTNKRLSDPPFFTYSGKSAVSADSFPRLQTQISCLP